MRVTGIDGNRLGEIQVLDPILRRHWPRTLIFAMKLLGIQIKEAIFLAGDLKSATGESASIAAGRWAQETSFLAAEEVVRSSSFLSNLNNAWGRNTVQLHLAKNILTPMHGAGMRVFVASALARDPGAEMAVLLISCPRDFPSSYLNTPCPNLKVRFHSPSLRLIRTGRLYLLFWLLRDRFTELKWRTETQINRILSRNQSTGTENIGAPSLLLIQESEVSLDRSYRTQPHWFFEAKDRPQFQTYILQDRSFAAEPVDSESLNRQGIQLISKKDVAITRNPRPPLPVQKRLAKDLQKCLVKSLLGRSRPEVSAAVRLSQLFLVAGRLTKFCRQANTKAFMTCENYHTEVDAIQLFAPELGIQTLSYQFANTGRTGPISWTNGDTMLMVSAHYHQQYANNGIHPVNLEDIGYPFESSFQLVRERAQTCRAMLERAGARFIICYFDENPTGKPYSVISPEDHIRDLLTLMNLVLDNESVGLVLKTKSIGTSPRFLEEISTVRESVEATGRYVELMRGTKRNIVFPAEAALAADMVIGHSAGATAVLESALAGTRGILLNPYGITGANDALYAQADIVYPTLEKAMEAIAAFRAGDPKRQGLGDWSAIIDRFDPVRDGKAGHRMRAALEKAMAGTGVSS